MTLSAAGMKADQIAEYLRMDPKTLRKYFSRELEHGATLLEGLAMQVLVQRALEGNVSAAKEIRAIAAARSAPKAAPRATAIKAAQMGKKDQLALEARRPPSEWGDLLN